MKKQYVTKDFDYDLPESLIAQYPLAQRSHSRLLVLDRATQTIQHQQFCNLVDRVGAKDLLVFNNTKVIPARLWGHKASGGKIECLVERILSSHRVLAHVRASKAPPTGSELEFNSGIKARVLGRQDSLFELQFLTVQSALEVLNQWGEMPLPPYVVRPVESMDRERYQTIFAEREGAVAAPTASLHFDHDIMQKIQNKGIQTATLTLHVGAGTFQPVRVESLADHVMHKEYIEVSARLCEQIKQTKVAGGRVIAVGTTVVRALETAARQGEIMPFTGDTDIFISPGFQFRVIDGLVTNFHLPQSTLLMLVAAFAGYELTMQTYREAVAKAYRFFSYGDAMVVV